MPGHDVSVILRHNRILMGFWRDYRGITEDFGGSRGLSGVFRDIQRISGDFKGPVESLRRACGGSLRDPCEGLCPEPRTLLRGKSLYWPEKNYCPETQTAHSITHSMITKATPANLHPAWRGGIADGIGPRTWERLSEHL